MTTAVLQYPPSPSSRSRHSYLSADNSTNTGNNRDSMVSTAASYETALASARPPSSVSGSATRDDRPSSPDDDSASVNPLHLLAASQSDNGTTPVHITRVSGDTVYVKHESSTAPRVTRVGKALDHGAHKIATIVSQSGGHRSHTESELPVGHKQHPGSRSNGNVVEGPNGLTPPPSPPSSESFRSHQVNPVLGGPTYDEPLDETALPPTTPTKTSSDSYSTNTATPVAPRHANSDDSTSTPSVRRVAQKSPDLNSLASSTNSFAYPRVTRDSPSLAPPSSFHGAGLSTSLPNPTYGGSILERTISNPIIPGLGLEPSSDPANAYTQSTHTLSSQSYSNSHSIAGSSRLHPSSATTPTSNTLPKPNPSRRNTTGSAGTPTHGRSRSLNLPGGSPSDFADSSMFAAAQAQGGMSRDVSLDSDIMKEAEQIRRERHSKRARERAAAQAEAEAKLTAAHPSRAGGSGGEEKVDQHQPAAAAVTISTEERDREKVIHAPKVEDDKVLVGNLIGEDHVNYVLMYNMLTGIRIGVSRCEAKVRRPLTPEDYTASHKYSFDIVGNELTPSARYDFKFKDYAPWVFREMREDNFYLDPADYLLSLTSKYILSELGSPGKSGSFFYFSRDYRFIIKTIHHTEHKFLRRILPLYHNHVKTNPHTLLSRFYGLHRVKLPRGRKIHFVIMNNLFPPHRDIHETYDLKGSTVGREYPEAKARDNPRAVLKDNNWINRGRVIELGPEKRALLTEQLRRDSEFLKQVNVMDYSLLIGIHNMQRGNRDNLRRNTLKVFKPDIHAAGLPPGASRRRRGSQSGRPDSSEAANLRRRERDRSSDGQPIGSLSTELPGLNSTDRQHFFFYQDEGGYRATDDTNQPMDIIYYLGVIDITTPYNAVKKMEHFWKGMRADSHKISPVAASEYATRFFAFLTASMRGGGGTERFKAE